MKKILIVEDEESLLETLANNFRYDDYEVLTATNGQDGLRMAIKQKPDAVLLDVSPRQLVAMAGGRLDGWKGRPYRRFRPGWGAHKVDYVLSGPMPWTAESARRAGTVHLGGPFTEVARGVPRLRRNANFHKSESEPANRLLNAIEPGSYIRPHRHLDPNKDETMVVLKGSLGML